MNKRFIIVVGLALSAVLGFNSISLAEGAAKFGILGGINIANADMEKVPQGLANKQNRLRFSGGVFAELRLSENAFLDLRGMYVQKGVKFNNNLASATASIDYLSIPALVKVKASNSRVRPFLFAGPELGFKVNAVAKVEALGMTEEIEDFADEVGEVDFALDFGGGIEFPTSTVTYIVQGLYSLGLSNVVRDSDDVGNVKSRGFMILTGVRF